MKDLSCITETRLPIGMIKTLDHSKISTDTDSEFYSSPRLITHTDDGWIMQLTTLYRRLIPPGEEVFDLMSSHVSVHPFHQNSVDHFHRWTHHETTETLNPNS